MKTEKKSQTYLMNSFTWSFKPILFLMAIIAGLKLDLSNIDSVLVKVAYYSYALLLVLTNILVNGSQAMHNLYYATGSLLEDLTSKVHLVLGTVGEECRLQMANGANYYYRYLLLILGVPIIFSVNLVIKGKWTRLWTNLRRIQKELRLNERFYANCRKQCYLGLGLFGLV